MRQLPALPHTIRHAWQAGTILKNQACLQFLPGADTEGMYTVVQQKLASKFGKEFTWALKSKMMGLKVPPAGRCC